MRSNDSFYCIYLGSEFKRQCNGADFRHDTLTSQFCLSTMFVVFLMPLTCLEACDCCMRSSCGVKPFHKRNMLICVRNAGGSRAFSHLSAFHILRVYPLIQLGSSACFGFANDRTRFITRFLLSLLLPARFLLIFPSYSSLGAVLGSLGSSSLFVHRVSMFPCFPLCPFMRSTSSRRFFLIYTDSTETFASDDC